MEGRDEVRLPDDVPDRDGALEAHSLDVHAHPREIRNSSAEIGAARKPRCGSATTSPSDVSRESASRTALRLTERDWHSSAIFSRAPGCKRQANRSARRRSYAS